MVIRSDYLLPILPNRFSLPASPGWGGAELGHPGPCSEAALLDGSLGFEFPRRDHAGVQGTVFSRGLSLLSPGSC